MNERAQHNNSHSPRKLNAKRNVLRHHSLPTWCSLHNEQLTVTTRCYSSKQHYSVCTCCTFYFIRGNKLKSVSCEYDRTGSGCCWILIHETDILKFRFFQWLRTGAVSEDFPGFNTRKKGKKMVIFNFRCWTASLPPCLITHRFAVLSVPRIYPITSEEQEEEEGVPLESSVRCLGFCRCDGDWAGLHAGAWM